MAKERKDFLHFQQVPDIRDKWGWFLGFGILLVLLGIFAIAYSGLTTEIAIIFLGFLLVAAGVMQLINSFHAMRWTGISLSLLLALLYLIAGLICIFRPVASAEAITLLLATFFFVGGFFRMFSALYLRFNHWGWIFFNGLIALLLGILIIVEWPISGLWVIGLFIGIDMLLMGWSWIILSTAARLAKK